MPKFDLSTVGEVEYDFTQMKGVRGSHYEGRFIEDKGIVPEPSRNLVSTTMQKVSEAFKQTGMEDVDDTPDSVSKAMEKIDDESVFIELSDKLLDAISELCDGSPSREALESLGWRRFMAFFGYIMKELMSPELSGTNGNASPTRLRSV